MKEEKVREIRKAPSATYERPEDVVSDDALSREQKIQILDAWKEDEKAKQRAASENMAPHENAEKSTDMLSRISKIRLQLENEKLD